MARENKSCIWAFKKNLLQTSSKMWRINWLLDHSSLDLIYVNKCIMKIASWQILGPVTLDRHSFKVFLSLVGHFVLVSRRKKALFLHNWVTVSGLGLRRQSFAAMSHSLPVARHHIWRAFLFHDAFKVDHIFKFKTTGKGWHPYKHPHKHPFKLFCGLKQEIVVNWW